MPEIKNANNLWSDRDLFGRKKIMIPKKGGTKQSGEDAKCKVSHFVEVTGCEREVAEEYTKKYGSSALDKYYAHQNKTTQLHYKPKFFNESFDTSSEGLLIDFGPNEEV